jgi:hypothetical protein
VAWNIHSFIHARRPQQQFSICFIDLPTDDKFMKYLKASFQHAKREIPRTLSALYDEPAGDEGSQDSIEEKDLSKE